MANVVACLMLAGCAGTRSTAPHETAAPVPARPLVVGLALGGGAARGYAHIGVIKVLEDNGIVPGVVTGTSAGSVVAALYASGMSGTELNRTALQLDAASISDWTLPFSNRGFLKGVALQRFLNQRLKHLPIERMPIRLGIVATDLQSGKAILFRSGNTGQAVRASCSVPSIFEPVKIGTREYVDGGLVSPVPASFARKMGADFVIAVDISSQPERMPTPTAFSVVLKTFAIMGQSIKVRELEQDADVVIQPDLDTMSGGDFSQREAAVLAGEEAARKIMPELLRKLAAARLAAGGLVVGRAAR